LLGNKCVYTTKQDLDSELKRLVLEDTHLKPYTRAILDARVAKAAKDAYDVIFQTKSTDTIQPLNLDFTSIQVEARATLEKSINEDTWRSKCKGRDLLRAFCTSHGITYDHFRNVLISNLLEPPKALADIINEILKV